MGGLLGSQLLLAALLLNPGLLRGKQGLQGGVELRVLALVLLDGVLHHQLLVHQVGDDRLVLGVQVLQLVLVRLQIPLVLGHFLLELLQLLPVGLGGVHILGELVHDLLVVAGHRGHHLRLQGELRKALGVEQHRQGVGVAGLIQGPHPLGEQIQGLLILLLGGVQFLFQHQDLLVHQLDVLPGGVDLLLHHADLLLQGGLVLQGRGLVLLQGGQLFLQLGVLLGQLFLPGLDFVDGDGGGLQRHRQQQGQQQSRAPDEGLGSSVSHGAFPPLRLV